MPKKRRLLSLPRKSPKVNSRNEDSPNVYLDREVRTARGRLMGALLEVLEADSDDEKYIPQNKQRDISDEDESNRTNHHSPQRHSYVLKLFDRSVDLSQFQEDTPLYPICRAWIQNQPKSKYSDWGTTEDENSSTSENTEELPPPEGPVVSRIPPLLPEQEARDKNNINLNYREAPPPSREHLMTSHVARWGGVRRAWLRQAALVEQRYSATQHALETKFVLKTNQENLNEVAQ